MTDRIELTDNMVRTAAKAGQVTEATARAMLAAAMEVMPRHYDGPRYPFFLRDAGSLKQRRARIICMGEQPGYFRIEAEDGQTMVVHANAFLPDRRPKQIDQQKKGQVSK